MAYRRQLRSLAKRVPEKYVGGNGRGFDAMDHSVVTQMLLLKIGPYSFEHVETLRSPTKKSPESHVVTGVIMRLSGTIDGEPFSITEAGGVENAGNQDGDGERMKHAMSDALKRCAMRVGLGLHIWAQDLYFMDELLKQAAERKEKQKEAQGDDREEEVNIDEVDGVTKGGAKT